jgi:hypothetical protein
VLSPTGPTTPFELKRAPGSWGWGVVAALVAIELVTFATYTQREIAWAYPGSYDQAAYLVETYQLGRDASACGLPKAVRQHFAQSHATGVLLPLQGAVHGIVLGPGRLAALSVNFAHFAFFQCVLVATLLWLSRDWWTALAGFGLTLTLKTVFQPAGGAFDFRMDFVSFCLFGVFLCALVRSRLLLDRRWAVAVGIAAAVLVLFRFLTAAYLGGLLGLLGASFVLRRLRAADSEAREQAGKRIRGWLVAVGILVVGTWPVLISQRKAIEAYYVVGHITSSEKDIRAAEFGVTKWQAAALFYPRSLYESHTGVMFWAVTGGLLAAGVLARARRTASAEETGANAVRCVLPIAALGFAVPFAVLNVSAMKSPVVGIVLLPAIVLAILAPLTAVAGNARPCVRRAAGILALFCGFFTQLNFAAAPAIYRQFNDDNVPTMRVLEDLIDAAERKGHASPEVFLDTNTPEFLALGLQAVEFEKRGRLRGWHDDGISIFAGSEEEHFRRLLRADVVILAGRPAGVAKYPYDEMLERMRPRIQAYCDAHLVKVGEYRITGRVVTTYVRGGLRMEEVAFDGWVTDKGVRLVGTLADLKRCRRIELRPELRNALGRVPGVTAEVKVGDRAPKRLAASVTGDLQSVRLDWEPVDLPAETPVEIHIRFDASFVPREQGIGPDPRSLVMYLGPQPRVHLIQTPD